MSNMTDTVDNQRKQQTEQLIRRSLQKFGLSDNEITVYLIALQHNELSPFQVAKLTNIPRTTVYDIFMSLSLKGLIDLEQNTGFEKQQTRIRAKNPSVMRKILETKRQETYDVETDLALVLPYLKQTYHKDTANALVEFFPGIAGMKHVYLDLEEAEQSYNDVISWTNLMPLDVLGGKVINQDVKDGTVARKRLNVRTKYLVPLNNWTRHVMTYQTGLDADYLQAREFRFIDSPLFSCYLEIVIAGNIMKAACAENEEVWGLVIRSKALIDTFRSIFMTQWTIAQPITEELVKSWGDNGFLKEQKKKKLL